VAEARVTPLRDTSVYCTTIVKANSAVAKTSPVTDRAGALDTRTMAPDLIGAVLLKLFDDRSGNEHFDTRQKRVVFKRGDRNRVHILQVAWLDRADCVAGATAKEKGRAKTNRESFHG
jgi:hypothetical protein